MTLEFINVNENAAPSGLGYEPVSDPGLTRLLRNSEFEVTSQHRICYLSIGDFLTPFLTQHESGSEHLSAEQAHHPLQVVGDAGQPNFRTGAVHTA